MQIMNRWLAIRIEFISNLVVFGTAILVSVVLPVNAGLAGLALTAAANLTDNLSWFVRMVSCLAHTLAYLPSVLMVLVVSQCEHDCTFVSTVQPLAQLVSLSQSIWYSMGCHVIAHAIENLLCASANVALHRLR